MLLCCEREKRQVALLIHTRLGARVVVEPCYPGVQQDKELLGTRRLENFTRSGRSSLPALGTGSYASCFSSGYE